MTIGEALDHGKKLLKRSGIESSHIDSSLLLEHITGRPRAELFAHLDDELDDSVASQYMELVSKRAERIPLVHLTHAREFYGLNFYIDENVLTPRVETEKMVELIIKHAPQNGTLIDVGTGSGAIAVAAKINRPDLHVTATDVTDEALTVAAKNIKTHKADIKLIKSDLFAAIGDRFDVVATNLPYLRTDADLMPEVRREPAVALYGGPDGLDLYRQFLTQLPDHLNEHGFLFTECDPWQQADLKAEAAKLGLQPIDEDYFILGFQYR